VFLQKAMLPFLREKGNISCPCVLNDKQDLHFAPTCNVAHDKL